MKYTLQVARWLTDAELYAPNIEPAVVLSIIHVESAGDPTAHRQGSQFWGMLQMGQLAGQDVGFRDRGKNTTKHLDGNAQAAIKAFTAYQKRYAHRHRDQADRRALLWKGGPGYLRFVNNLTDKDTPLDHAVALADEEYNFNGAEYLQRFRAAYDIWSKNQCLRS